MIRITAAHIGIEQLSAICLDDQEQSLPGRYALLPDGKCIEPHISRLYPANLVERTLYDFATPVHYFPGLLRPRDFTQAMAGLWTVLEAGTTPELKAASELLKQLIGDEQLMQMTLHLLHKV
ncbi:YscX family type III secretion protein [Aeromonas salmonicida]|uniref:type III secretion apparatus assembly protein SctX n=1 Tax=Aeromonas salmonicida TaxID=645 RepID=UPI00232C71A4|nr:YscX family type III secretion protein [Aeromonas salmonicida]WCH23613.1 YscX family type III secretion protein [Aeromonas salmonicida]